MSGKPISNLADISRHARRCSQQCRDEGHFDIANGFDEIARMIDAAQQQGQAELPPSEYVGATAKVRDCNCQRYNGRDCRKCFNPPYPNTQPMQQGQAVACCMCDPTGADGQACPDATGTPLCCTAPPSAPVGGFVAWLDRDWPLWRNNPDNPNVARLRRAWEAALAQQPAAEMEEDDPSHPDYVAYQRYKRNRRKEQPAAVDETARLTERQAVIVTGYTGALCCKFDAFHADLERRAGRRVWTHEMGNHEWIKPMYRDDFLALATQHQEPTT